MPGILLDLDPTRSSYGGAHHVTEVIARTVAERFPVTDDPEGADLRLCRFGPQPPERPRRLFLDHGSFADAGFWAYRAPTLRTDDAVLVSSRVCLDVADRLLGDRRPHLELVPFFVETERFRPADDRQAARRRIGAARGLPPDQPWLLSISGYSRRKHLHLALHVLRHLVSARGPAQLLFIGRPNPDQMPYRRRLEELTAELGLDGMVHHVDVMPHEELSGLMAAADLLVHLTNCRLENFGLVVAEALASGLPVLAADWGGLRDLIRHGENGVLATTHLTRGGPRTDWLGAMDDVVALLADRDRWAAVSRRAVEGARRDLAVDGFRTRLCDAVERVLERPSGGERVKLSPTGEDLLFSTLMLYRRHPETRTTGDEFRLLLDADEGASCRILAGPAATREEPPPVRWDDALYPIVASTLDGTTLHITDPAWERDLPLTEEQAALVPLCDGARSLRDACTALSLPTPDDTIPKWIQDLVSLGALAPHHPPGSDLRS